jgi:nitronate monooxygenase
LHSVRLKPDTTEVISARSRASAFCDRYGLTLPILLAPMAGACPPQLSAAIARAGGMGAMGALITPPDGIRQWVDRFRADIDGPVQLNLWIPGAERRRDRDAEARVAAFLSQWGPPVPPGAADTKGVDFDAQCEAMVESRPTVISSIMGLYSPRFVQRMKDAGIAWFACATTLAEARQAQEAGADAIVAQGAEAGGHRGAFDPDRAAYQLTGSMALIPRLADHLSVPVIAAGGIADARGIAAALMLGASAVQIGTAFLRCPEAGTHQAWADALRNLEPESTRLTRAFSGRLARAVATTYVDAAAGPDAPVPAPYPIQRNLTARMREEAATQGDLQRMQAWAGQAAALARAEPAAELVRRWWSDVNQLLP